MLKRIFCLLAVMMMLLPAALAEDAAAPAVEAGAFPVLNDEGFLDVGEFVYVNAEAGVWRYVDDQLKVEIFRRNGQNQNGTKACWYEAEVWSRGDDIWQMVAHSDINPMKDAVSPHILARKKQIILGINTDYAQTRQSSERPGLVIRNGVDPKSLANATLKATSKKWPPLDILALYPDGNMEVYDSDEHTLKEYIDMGVQTTLAFGPYLIRDGVRNDADVSSMSVANNPRTAIGMIEKGHFFAVMVEGRVSTSYGSNLVFLADLMEQKGCTTAFNLDGGMTACMIFMGEQINASKNNYARPTTELLSIGRSTLVPAYKKK